MSNESFKKVCDLAKGFVACKQAYAKATDLEKEAVDEMVKVIKSTNDEDDIALCIHTIAGVLHPYL